MTHKETAQHIRSQLKAAGIKARCRMVGACGNQSIKIFTAKHGDSFSVDEQREILRTAKAAGLTWILGDEIDVDHVVPGYAHYEFYRYAQ